MALAALGLGVGDHLDRGLLAACAQGGDESPHLLLVLNQAVAHQVALVDHLERQRLDQASLAASAGEGGRELVERSASRSLAGNLRDGRAAHARH